MAKMIETKSMTAWYLMLVLFAHRRRHQCVFFCLQLRHRACGGFQCLHVAHHFFVHLLLDAAVEDRGGKGGG